MSLMVDPEILRAFAGQVETASASIRSADVGGEVSHAAAALAGSTIEWAARLVGEHVATQAGAIATQVDAMGRAVRGAGNAYEITDADLAGSFAGIF